MEIGEARKACLILQQVNVGRALASPPIRTTQPILSQIGACVDRFQGEVRNPAQVHFGDSGAAKRSGQSKAFPSLIEKNVRPER
jgi:hypothetical protein